MNINDFYNTYEEPENIDDNLDKVVSTLIVSKGKSFDEEEQNKLKNYFFKTKNDVVMTPELEASFPMWVFDNIEKVTDYINYDYKLVIDENLDNVVEDEGIKLHWRVSYYDVNKNICNVNENKNIAYRILEILFDC